MAEFQKINAQLAEPYEVVHNAHLLPRVATFMKWLSNVYTAFDVVSPLMIEAKLLLASLKTQSVEEQVRAGGRSSVRRQLKEWREAVTVKNVKQWHRSQKHSWLFAAIGSGSCVMSFGLSRSKSLKGAWACETLEERRQQWEQLHNSQCFGSIEDIDPMVVPRAHVWIITLPCKHNAMAGIN